MNHQNKEENKMENKMESISVKKRDLNVKAKKMRRIGMIPGNVFGKEIPEAISIQIEETVARKLIRQKHEGSKLFLNIEGQTMLVQVKEKSFDAVKNEILHISFQALTADEKVNSVIHILLEKKKKIEGLLERMLLEIPYTSLPADMIDTITIDLDGMKTGTVIAVKDIPELMGKKIELQVHEDDIVLRLCERRDYVETPSEE